MFRSKTRTAVERFRRQFTMKRPYCCHERHCRGWTPDATEYASPSDVLDTLSSPPDLDSIDAALSEAERTPDA